MAACALLHRSERPDEVHLCAAALSQDELAALAGHRSAADLGRREAHLYYAAPDLVLALAFRVLAGGSEAVQSLPKRPLALAVLAL